MKPIFRTTMFGFNKEDVFNFITKQNKQYDQKLSELNAELDRQKAEFDLEREGFERDSDEIESLKHSLHESNELLKNISVIFGEILDDGSRVRNCAAKVKEEHDIELDRFKEMKKRVDEAETLREKAEKFDRLSGVLSSIFNQQETASSAPGVTVGETLDQLDCVDTNSVCDLLDYVEVLSVRLEKLRDLIPSEKQDA